MVAALELAVLRSGLSAAGFARALGTSPSRFSTYRSGKIVPSATLLVRAVRIGEALERARERDVATSISAALDVERAINAGGGIFGVRAVALAAEQLDELLRRHHTLAPAWQAVPTTRHAEWDALLAAVVAHTFETHGLVPPRWTDRPSLPHDWFPWVPLRSSEEEIAAATPDWLSARGIFLTEEQIREVLD